MPGPASAGVAGLGFQNFGRGLGFRAGFVNDLGRFSGL